ncbi:unnamed protein product [Toxocara canis]|uniref:DIX domain-containing protein n=1 Tax=Toxocara canis TaxID=6265 RepID=A0A183U439_TOXCA|nr:unnamed protein product [Toxocara canis]
MSFAEKIFQVYYHIDDEKTPYCTDVQVPPDKITLGDFKLVLNRSNFKYFCKAPAPDSGVFEEVKVEIRDDNERLHRSANGQFELFLLTSEGSSHSDGSAGLPMKVARHHMHFTPFTGSVFGRLHLSAVLFRDVRKDVKVTTSESRRFLSVGFDSRITSGCSLNRHHYNERDVKGRRNFQLVFFLKYYCSITVEHWMEAQVIETLAKKYAE